MKPYKFSNIKKNLIKKADFNELLHSDVDIICDYLWLFRDIIKDFAPDFFKAASKEDFKDEWKDRISAAKNFMIENGFCRYKEYDLYRAVILGPDDIEPNLKEPGSCWATCREDAEFFGNLILDMDDDPNFAICILNAEVNIEYIDLLGTLILNAIEPSEKEIRLYNDAQFESIEYEVL